MSHNVDCTLIGVHHPYIHMSVGHFDKALRCAVGDRSLSLYRACCASAYNDVCQGFGYLGLRYSNHKHGAEDSYVGPPTCCTWHGQERTRLHPLQHAQEKYKHDIEE